MYNPLISIIIPTYKRKPELIKRSVISALNQTYDNTEIIIVDDSPNDYPFKLEVEKYVNLLKTDKIKYINHVENKGANIARNTGIKAAKGEYCAFLDDDDEWELNKLDLQIKKFDDPQVGLVYCKGNVYNKINKDIKPVRNELIKGHVFERLMWNNFIGGNSFVLISKACLDKVGNFADEMLSNQDWELFLRISKQYKVDFVDDFLVNYYEHSEERITTDPSKKIQGWLYMYNIYFNYLNEHKDVKNNWDLNLIIQYLKNHQFFVAIKLTIKTLVYSPSKFLKFIYFISQVKLNKI